MKRRTNLKTLAVLTTLGLASVLAHAGPEDQFSKYKVGVTIGGVTRTGIADSGGTTTISFDDAKRMGFLDANGDPDFPPNGTQRMGGTGGGSVTCHIFRNITVKVQPRKADGTANGPAREINVTVFVPKKPSEQTGANDAEKNKKTKSVPTKIGANVCGSTIEGHKLDFTDRATNNPKKNDRSTGWRKVGQAGGGKPGTDGADRSAPAQEDDNFEDEILHDTFLPGLLINGQPCAGGLSMAPIMCFGQQAAQQYGVPQMDLEILDFENHQLLFLAGVLDVLPDQENLLMLPIGQCLIEHPTLEGDLIPLQPVLSFIIPEADPWMVFIGSNAIVPPEVTSWFDNDEGLLLWDFDLPCPGDFNGDGVVNTLDVLEFLNEWNLRTEDADVNYDGVVNTLDLLEFLNTWTSGCE